MAMAKVLNQERFLPPRLPGLSLWLDAQATTTISSTAAGVTSWADRSGMGNTMNATTFYVPGCVLWLDAADTTTYVGPTTSLTGWKDKSGRGNNPTLLTSTLSGPSVVTNPNNNLPGLTFPITSVNSTNPGYTYGNPFTVANLLAGTNYSMIGVVQYAPQNGAYGMWAAGQWKNYYGSVLALTYGGISLILSGSSVSPPGTATPFSPHIYAVSISSSTTSVNATTIAGIDGADAVYMSTAGPNTAETVSPFGIGADIEYGTAYYPLTGYLHELIVFNQTLTLGQLNSIETYLSKKWGGIPLSYSVPTTPLFFSPTISPVPIISNTLTNQPSIFFPPGGQMGSILNSGLGAPTIPGCTLWLDAADPNATGVPADNGTAITIWKDKSGLGSNATATGTPTIISSGLNGRPTMNFNGSSWFKGATANTTSNLTVFTVVMLNGTAGNNSRIVSLATPTKVDYDTFTEVLAIQQNFNTTFISTGRNTQPPTGGTWNFVQSIDYSTTSNVPYIAGALYNGSASTQTLFINGSANVTNTITGAFGYTSYGIGNYSAAPGASEPFTGKISEVIVFTTALTISQRQTVEGYLATKWGLRANLPPTHPYSSVPYTAPFALNPSGPVSKSLFMAYQCPQTSSRMRFAVGRDVSGQAFGLAQSNGVVYSPYQYGYGDTKWSVTPNTYIVPTMASAVFDAGATMIRGDHAFNSFLDVRETALLNIIPNTPYVLGTSLSASSVFVSASFHVCEIIAYNRALATTDRQMIEGYLAWKWGMTTQLPNGHPYQKFPPTGEQVIVASTPSNLYSGLVSWLDMADSTTYTLSGNTTNLKTLTDKVGGGAFTLSGNVSISTLGSLPSLSFTGNNSAILQLGGFLSKTLTVPPRGCAFAVFTPASEQLGAEKLGLLGWGSPGNNSNNPALGYTVQSSTTLRSYNPINPLVPQFYGPSISLAVSKPAILFWAWYNGNMVYLASNGNSILSTTQTTGLFNPASTNNIFYIGNDGGFGAKFNLGELCVYNDYLETPFRNILEGYLAWKWGVQSNLPSVHPYALSAPTLQSLTEVNALSQPTDISGLTMWLDAGDTATLTGNLWLDKSAISNNLSGTITPSNFGPPARPSIYFGPGTSATSIYNSGADSKQFSAFLVASIPTLSYLLISTGQLTTGTTGVAGQTFGFYASNGVSSVFSPYVVQGSGASNNTVGNYSVISGRTFEVFASICGTAVSGNMNFATPLSNVNNTANNITATPWVFGNCTGDTLAKSFHVHEFITYSRPVTTVERQSIEGYLYWKWMV